MPDRFRDAAKGLPVERRPEPIFVPIEGADEELGKEEKEQEGTEKKPAEDVPKAEPVPATTAPEAAKV